jgi:hypothetical protein
MKNFINKLRESISRALNRNRYWEEALEEWDDYDWADVTDPIIYIDEYDLSPLPNNVIQAAQRFTKGIK